MNKKVNIQILRSIISSSRFTLLILILIILNFILPILYSANVEYLTAFINVNNHSLYNFFVALVLLFSTLNTLKIFETHKEIIIRYTDKKRYFNELTKTSIIANLIIILINYMLLLTVLNFYANPLKVTIIKAVGTTSLIYSIYFFVKKVLLFELLSIVFLLIDKNFSKNISLIISLILASCLAVTTYKDDYINTFSKFRIFYWEYFVYHRYSSFSLEISFFGIYFSIVTVLVYIFYQVTSKNLKEIGE